LVNELAARGVGIGIATSVKKDMWEQAEIYPVQRNFAFAINERIIQQLRLFDF
jgi:hypothetical protein